jgi:drug/metabolite transporter (DMT)-like permease
VISPGPCATRHIIAASWSQADLGTTPYPSQSRLVSAICIVARVSITRIPIARVGGVPRARLWVARISVSGISVGWVAVIGARWRWRLFFPGAAALLNFESNRLLGPNIAGALSSMTPVLAVILAIVMLGERIRGPQLLGLAAIVVGISLMYRVHVNVSVRSLWLLAVPLAAAAIRGVVQPIIKFGFEWWPNAIAAVVVGYTVSSTVLIVSALVRTRWTIPDVDHRGALWFAVVGLCNGLSVLAMYAALEYGPVAVVSPIVAGYPLVILLLSRAFLEKEHVGLQLIGGVTSAVCGVVLLLVT